jgi:hypothetical protein
MNRMDRMVNLQELFSEPFPFALDESPRVDQAVVEVCSVNEAVVKPIILESDHHGPVDTCSWPNRIIIFSGDRGMTADAQAACKRYQRQAPLMLTPNVFCIAADEQEFRYGTILFRDASKEDVEIHMDTRRSSPCSNH